MADSDDYLNPFAAAGIAVALDPEMSVMSLRYFEPHGAFAAAVRRCLGLQLPFEPNAIEVADRRLLTLLAWRRPGECLLLSRDAAIIEGVATATVSLGDGRAINITGGACVVHISGPQTGELLSRIGCHDSMPAPRSSRATRVADLPVVLVRTEGLDVHLLLDRVYLEHMMHWLRVSIDDVSGRSL
jgi:heterotetrameric sarcosine oxidase gamma subunit